MRTNGYDLLTTERKMYMQKLRSPQSVQYFSTWTSEWMVQDIVPNLHHKLAHENINLRDLGLQQIGPGWTDPLEAQLQRLLRLRFELSCATVRYDFMCPVPGELFNASSMESENGDGPYVLMSAFPGLLKITDGTTEVVSKAKVWTSDLQCPLEGMTWPACVCSSSTAR